MVVDQVIVTSGTRIGYWKPGGWGESPFHPKGYYTGPDLGDFIPGALLKQELMEGTLEFRVGVLFRPDLGKRNNFLETILIIEKWVPEVFEYEGWDEEIAV